jgi:hypothetical protein
MVGTAQITQIRPQKELSHGSNPQFQAIANANQIISLSAQLIRSTSEAGTYRNRPLVSTAARPL